MLVSLVSEILSSKNVELVWFPRLGGTVLPLASVLDGIREGWTKTYVTHREDEPLDCSIFIYVSIYGLYYHMSQKSRLRYAMQKQRSRPLWVLCFNTLSRLAGTKMTHDEHSKHVKKKSRSQRVEHDLFKDLKPSQLSHAKKSSSKWYPLYYTCSCILILNTYKNPTI